MPDFGRIIAVIREEFRYVRDDDGPDFEDSWVVRLQDEYGLEIEQAEQIVAEAFSRC